MNKTGSIQTKRDEIYNSLCIFLTSLRWTLSLARTFVCQVTYCSRKNRQICGRQSLSFPVSASTSTIFLVYSLGSFETMRKDHFSD